ncbi:hypothetical protein [Klebsiella pneumoniae]|uniref:hypothetical protein n=1 Tax=Klebsiella pneumoniae TaxID=573 RepID=UPI000E2D180D|nr:hypothetical protein [Klebsiella pneumoniae]SXM94755.1 Uncharacterised protein [Klebsiella pneumoniae]
MSEAKLFSPLKVGAVTVPCSAAICFALKRIKKCTTYYCVVHGAKIIANMGCHTTDSRHCLENQ